MLPELWSYMTGNSSSNHHSPGVVSSLPVRVVFVPTHRLKVMSDAVYVKGYPSSHPFLDEAIDYIYLSLIAPSPAELEYVMETAWHSKLITAPPIPSAPEFTMQYIPRLDPNLATTHTDEEEHCLRMRRCGSRRGQVRGTHALAPKYDY